MLRISVTNDIDIYLYRHVVRQGRYLSLA
ncbi:hypothetical protein ACLBR5_05115 [Escherichia coli]